MKINIYGSTGKIGTKTLSILNKHFPQIKINLLCANNNVEKLIRQTNLLSPKYIYLSNKNYIKKLKNNIKTKTTVLDYNELISYLAVSSSDYSILAISGYKSLYYLDSTLGEATHFNSSISHSIRKSPLIVIPR